MSCRFQILCKVFCHVEYRFNVKDYELSLTYLVANPVEAHVNNSFRSFLLYRIVDDSDSTGIIAHYDSWGLGMSKIR